VDALLIGFGEDSHRLAPGRRLVLGSVTIPDAPRGADAHSDGDVLIHALSDAILSSFALGDIGMHFPDSDPAFDGMDSTPILQGALGMARAAQRDAHLIQVVAVVTLDEPKLGVHRAAIAGAVAALVGLPTERVGLTFKTSEGLAPDHVQARVVVSWDGSPARALGGGGTASGSQAP